MGVLFCGCCEADGLLSQPSNSPNSLKRRKLNQNQSFKTLNNLKRENKYTDDEEDYENDAYFT